MRRSRLSTGGSRKKKSRMKALPKMDNFKQLNSYVMNRYNLGYRLDEIVKLEKESSKGMLILGSDKEVKARAVRWWNEPERGWGFPTQRSSFILMQLLKKHISEREHG